MRDYVHVDDIAHAHILALNPAIESGVYNLAGGEGTSVKQIMEQARTIVGKMPYVGVGPKRAGDPAVLTASADKFDRTIGMRWRSYNLTDVLRHTWAWYTR